MQFDICFCKTQMFYFQPHTAQYERSNWKQSTEVWSLIVNIGY